MLRLTGRRQGPKSKRDTLDKDPKAGLVRLLENASRSRTTGIVFPSNEKVLISERRLEPP
jgi:hypothetical protein